MNGGKQMNERTTSNSRLTVIDVMRGFAIFGILVVNMPNFHSPAMYIETEQWWPHAIDRWTETVVDLIAQASFYPLFAFLFGFSMILFRERMSEKGVSFPRIFSRRLLALFMIGAFHAFFIWYGDILIAYALTGCLLLLFYRVHTRVWFIGAILCFFVPHLIVSLFLGLALLSGENGELSSNHARLADEAIQHYRDGTVVEIFWQRWHDWMYINGAGGLLFTILTLLGIGLFGGYVAQKQWFTCIEQHVGTIRRLCLIAFITGILLKLLPYFTEKNLLTEYVQDIFGGTALALFYAAAIVLLFQRERWRKVLLPFAAVGRMSLTNYLFQSVVCTMLFYHYGFALYGSVRPFYGELIAIVIYVVQVIASQRWLQSFRMGPFEWVWRTITYGKKQPLKHRVSKQKSHS
ncbi:uncharacterized protein HNR31_001629 [Anoxybacillus caldiproteolyticus]|uniref:DUF418 domain-containing protein n=2 Tax=Thermaerobacillus caldiproteolyticus TaxID=247480 RepID=A0A7V9Z6L0_9BACL|nr:uncharacterized protein [Anoxybacillus caldiproteolyticus]